MQPPPAKQAIAAPQRSRAAQSGNEASPPRQLASANASGANDWEEF
jgi:hypothetical protein